MSLLSLGLDVSPLRIGWGLADLETGTPVDCGIVRISDDHPIFISSALEHIKVVGLLGWDRPMPSLITVEAPHIGLNRAGAVRHALAIGSAWQAAYRRWPDAPITFVQPSEWKRRAGVEPNPRGVKSKRQIAMAAIEHGQLGCAFSFSDDHQAQILKADKPFVYLRALELGFTPNGSQDAADAGLIAVAGALINTETVAIHQAREVACP